MGENEVNELLAIQNHPLMEGIRQDAFGHRIILMKK
jgi:hypothetical protein